MNFENLREQAQKILDNVPTGEFKDISFSCRSGGSPANKAGIPEVRRSDDFAYPTVRNGDAYKGEVVIRCRDTGALDGMDRKIYEAENGMVFVFDYHSGSPEWFDSGALISPEMS